jgi:hypothetical protein
MGFTEHMATRIVAIVRKAIAGDRELAPLGQADRDAGSPARIRPL